MSCSGVPKKIERFAEMNLAGCAGMHTFVCMNQKQRDFLMQKVKTEIKRQADELKSALPARPDLRSYLEAEIIRGTASPLSAKDVKGRLSEYYGKGKSIFDSSRYHSNSVVSKDFERSERLTAPAWLFFKLPAEYVRLKAEYEAAVDKYHEALRLLTAKENSLITRIQLASNATLDGIIQDVDAMGSIDLVGGGVKLLEG